MAEAVPAASAPRVSRLDRRKARTRQALIDAAVRLIAEGRGNRASIQEITERADIGFGSFYNHFDSKEQLFQTASEEVMERWGQMIDRASAGITDPAELFAVGLRISGRLGWTHPDIAGFLTGAGLDALDIPGGLAPRALRDIEAGQAAGRFTVPERQMSRVPPDFSVPIPANHAAPFSMIAGTAAKVSTLFTTVGAPNRPTTAGNGGFSLGQPFFPSSDSNSAVSSPQM